MLLKALYVRFYKSFNYDYLRKSAPNAVPDPWDILEGDLFYPCVRIPMEKQSRPWSERTNLARVNCSTRSGVYSPAEASSAATSAVTPHSSPSEKRWQFPSSAPSSATSDDDGETIRALTGLDANAEAKSFWLFRFNKRTVIYVTGADGNWVEKPVTAKALEKVSLPSFFEIDAKAPLPDSVPIDYLVAPKSSRALRPRTRLLGFRRVAHR